MWGAFIGAGTSMTSYVRTQLVILGIAAMLVAFFLVWLYRTRDERRQDLMDAYVQATKPGVIHVEVGGTLGRQGVHEIPAGTTVGELADTIGGPGTAARLDPVWRDIVPTDGSRVDLWEDREGILRVAFNVMRGRTAGVMLLRMDINQASAEDLESLPGIGPSLARAIVAYREQHGPFERIEDLLEVKGIGPATLKRIRYLVLVGRDSTAYERSSSHRFPPLPEDDRNAPPGRPPQ